MNETTDKLLRDLAAKLGTTVDHLWAVLVKQAPIHSAVALLQYALIALACYFWYRSAKWMYQGKEDERMGAAICLIFSGIGLLIVAGFALFSLPEVIAGFFNPEYWALGRVMNLN